MRVSSGLLRGRKIRSRALQGTIRPTRSLVREALFNILQGRIEGSIFLDLYAGTGAVGCEALSRGAKRVVFVEGNRNYARDIKDSIRRLGLCGRAEVVARKVRPFLKDAELRGRVFDIIFLDPPYHTDEIYDILPLIGRSHLIREGGIMVVEHFVKKDMPHETGNLILVRNYVYGDTVLSLYKRKGD